MCVKQWQSKGLDCSSSAVFMRSETPDGCANVVDQSFQSGGRREQGRTKQTLEHREPGNQNTA